MLFVLASFFRKLAAPALSLASLDDEQLMARYAAGEAAAFEELLARHERKILNFVYRSVGDRDRAQDLAQEVWMRVIKSAPRYQPAAKFTTWLYTVARNVCIDTSRRDAKRRTASLDAPIGDEDGAAFIDSVRDKAAIGPATRLSRDAFLAQLHRALDALPEQQREVFVLRHYEGLRFVEIAAMFGISENTVKSRMRYALTQLRAALAEFGDISFDDADRDEVGAERT